MTLTAQWKCQDNAANTTVVATVGSNGTLSTGTTAGVSVADGPGTILTRSFQLASGNIGITASRASTSTVCAWCKFPLVTATSTLIAGVTGGNAFYFANGASLEASIYNGSVIGSGYNLTTPSSGWRHLACVTIGSSSQWYVDGVSVGSAISGALGTSFETALGDPFAQVWANKSCDVRIYDSDESANLTTIMAEAGTGGITGTFYNANGPGSITLSGIAETVNVDNGEGTVTVTGSAGTFNADNGVGYFVVA